MSPEQEKAILRFFPAGADVATAFESIEDALKRLPASSSVESVGALITELAPIYSRYTHQKITLAVGCKFVAFVNAVAQGHSWTVSAETIRDITMRQRPPAAERSFGVRGAQ